ncbi:formylglycine-generating enzyme family protein [Sorangium cellulosum]|uniref:formylglycine-generating enzyme family protein n=1 Tax=Sorangium cellulosum TaxID=56 RepID=UPI003D9A89C6
MSARDKLRDWPTYEQTTSAERHEIARWLASALGPRFTAETKLVGRRGLVAVRLDRPRISYVAIPGGTFLMGLSDLDHEDAQGRIDPYEDEAVAFLEAFRSCATPVRYVEVPAFLCARRSLRAADVKILGMECDADEPTEAATLSPRDAANAATTLGARLLSEAEWEYIAREGGKFSWINAPADPEEVAAALAGDGPHRAPACTSGLGLWGLALGEWVADGWHDSYAGAPADASPWDARDEPEVFRGCGAATYPWQGSGELLAMHAAFRHRACDTFEELHVRTAMDLP